MQQQQQQQQQTERLAFISLEGQMSFSVDVEGDLPPASVIVVDDPFYRATSDDPNDFGYEEPALGTLRVTAILGHSGNASWTVIFEFEDGSTITATAWLPVVNRRPGAGMATITLGSGRFGDLPGHQLEVRVRNPHRWTVS
jgi:hypothetical protein